MIEVASGLSLTVDFAADPFVIELSGRPRRNVVLRFDVYGVPLDRSLAVEVLPIAARDGFTFAALADRIDQRREGRSESQPVQVALPIRCTAEGSQQGHEGRSELTVRLRLDGDPPGPAPFSSSVTLIASAARRLPLWQVLREELLELVRDETWKAALRDDPLLDDPAAGDREKLSHLFARIHALDGPDGGLAGLCFSGGGIRSATFNLGILQGLVDAGLLGRFDYLSSVSGGGYVSSWLAGWVHRADGLGRVTPDLETPRRGGRVEAYPIGFLRRYSNYLTPRLGALSPDTWTLVAIVLRNLLLNWLVFLPTLAAVLALPLLVIAGGWPQPDGRPWLLPALYGAGLLAGGVGLFFMSALRASVVPKQTGAGAQRPRGYLRRGLLPVLAAATLLSWASALYIRDGAPSFVSALWWSAAWTVAVPIAAFVLGILLQRTLDRPRLSYRRDFAALLFSGAASACVAAWILSGWAKPLLDGPYLLFPLLAPVLVLATMLLGKAMFVAFASVAEGRTISVANGEAEREWWARWSAWTLIAATVWVAGAAIAYFAPTILGGVVERVTALVGAGGLGALVSRLGKSPGGAAWKQLALALAAPLFCLLLLLLVAFGTQELLAAVFPPATAAAAGAAAWWVPPFRGELWQVAVAILTLAGVGILLGRFVDVNRFSLQAMYRNRLVRAYLGASNARRRPNPFTGFDSEDDLPLHRLRGNRPWPLINIALNLVRGEELAWQERKAESFTATPLHCGSARLGYRRSQVYGGENGISLGTAIATSGAAASPSMGYHSSPAISFIMALFNARLGAWLGNPGEAGAQAYTRVGPAVSTWLLLAEALGQTDDRQPYVYLSDGGHFENLGLYEMVRRRCRLIVVCDAGSDPGCHFDDLGNAIRKVRIDHGVPIDFDPRIRIFPRSQGEPPPDAAYCAVGTIEYKAIDGAEAKTGTLLYIKPAILDEEPYDVTNYARTARDFPHESTVDQWFSESQFESYRALGKNVIRRILARGPHERPLASLRELRANVEKYLESP